MGKEKTDDMQFVDEQSRKFIEDKRRYIEAELKRREEREAVIIQHKEDQSGGLQGFDGIRLFKDLKR